MHVKYRQTDGCRSDIGLPSDFSWFRFAFNCAL